MLAIAAFLGWGRAIYQRYKPFVPTPFLNKFEPNDEVVLIRQMLGEPPATWSSSSGSGSGGTGRYERSFRIAFPLQPDNADTFLEKLKQRIRDQLTASGCKVNGSGGGSSGGFDEIRLRYDRDVVEGSVRVILIPAGDEARLLVFVEERRHLP